MKKLPLSLRMKMDKEEHYLSNFEKHQVEWDRLKSHFQTVTNKKPESLLFSQSEMYRPLKVEPLSLFHLATSIPDRMGIDYWQLTLRNSDNMAGNKFRSYKAIGQDL